MVWEVGNWMTQWAVKEETPSRSKHMFCGCSGKERKARIADLQN